MSFSEQIIESEIVELCEIGYGCFNVKLHETLKDKTQIVYIAEKLDRINQYGNYGTSRQHLVIFKEICNYLAVRGIRYKIYFSWTFENNIYYNIKCLFYLLLNKNWLETYSWGG